jgi:hypothetical protein
MNAQTIAIENLNNTDHGIIAFDLFGKEVKPYDIAHIENIILQEELLALDLFDLMTSWGAYGEWVGDIQHGEPGLYSLIQEQDKSLRFKFICGLEALKRLPVGLA